MSAVTGTPSIGTSRPRDWFLRRDSRRFLSPDSGILTSMFEQQEEPAFGDGETPDVRSAKPGAGDAGTPHAGTAGSSVVDTSGDADAVADGTEATSATAGPVHGHREADGSAADVPAADVVAVGDGSGTGGPNPGGDAPEDTLAGLFRPDITPDADAVAAWIADLDADALLEVMSTAGRMAARAQAIQLRAMDAFARRRPSDDPRREVSEFAVDEIAPELRLSRAAAQNTLALARALCHRLPATLAALHGGEIDLPKAHLIAEYTTPLDDTRAAPAPPHALPPSG